MKVKEEKDGEETQHKAGNVKGDKEMLGDETRKEGKKERKEKETEIGLRI